MAVHSLSKNFAAFFKRLNPSPTYIATASRAQQEIRRLIEKRNGTAEDLLFKTFIQGSYGRDTAIYTINDVDIVALANLTKSPSANRRTRDQLFEILGASIGENDRYAEKIQYGPNSMCVKVMLSSIKIEVLPALKEQGKGYDSEPFQIFGPVTRNSISDEAWVPTFAREHQQRMSNRNNQTKGMLIPMVKVMKHLRSLDKTINDDDAPSYLLECLLYAMKPSIYSITVGDCIERLLTALKGFNPVKAHGSGLRTPCSDKWVFETEWELAGYQRFYDRVICWQDIAALANCASDKDRAIEQWKILLGDKFFHSQVNSP